MEKTPAACAMEWSIHLDKCLRSKLPGKAIEGILEIGSRLEWWMNSEPNLTMAEYKMFGLIPGEDKLFLNAIFLRLADAFRLGDKQTKICVVKMFLSLRKKCLKMGDWGILCKDKLENYQELLRRVKIVFDSGDVEERALALGLFGCWANVAKDSAHVRYLLLSSLVSGDVLEVRASLFASSCFCEMADDFASVFLEILVNNLISSETTSSMRLAAARAFAKLHRPFLLADRTYKTGLKLALDSSEEDFTAVMLISLSKIASKWTLLIPGQIKIIFSFLSKKMTLKLQLTAWRCLHIILARGVCHLPSSLEAMQNFLNIIDESESPLVLRSEALTMLYKVLLYYLPGPNIEVLFRDVTNIIQKSIMSKRLFAFSVLVDFSKNLFKVPEVALDGTGSTLLSQLILFIMDRILLLMESNVDVYQSDTEMKLELKSLLNLLFDLEKENSDFAGLMLDRMCGLTDNLVRVVERNEFQLKADLLNPGAIGFRREAEISFSSEIMRCLSKLMAACLEDHPYEVSTKVLNVAKLLVENICQCAFFDVYTHTIYSLFFHAFITYRCTWNEVDKITNFNGSSRQPCDDPLFNDSYILEHEIITIEYAKKVIGRKDNWASYKIARYAACRGVWSAAAIMFEKLPMVQSDYFNCWLKTLAQISSSERQIELLGHLHSRGNSSDKEEGVTRKINLHNCIETLHEACKIYLLSEQKLAASCTAFNFCFQRWLLTLRAKVLGTVVDVVNLMHTNSFAPDSTSRNGQVEGSKRINSLFHPFTLVSNQFKYLALEFDLLAMSSIGMDSKSMIIILVLALSCSLLAFGTGFACFILNSDSSESIGTCDSEEPLYTSLIQDLVGRLWYLDCETCTNLRKLLKVFQGSKSISFPHSRKLIAGTCCGARSIIELCWYAVTGILGLQNRASKVDSDEGRFQIFKDGLEILLNIISIWIQIPFQIPNHFFRVRPCLSCELYLTNEEGINVDGISVASGFYIPLNLCLQLRNMPTDLPIEQFKFYCILSCTRSIDTPVPIGDNKLRTQLSFQGSGAEDMVKLHLRLLHYVTGSNDVKDTWKTSCGGENCVVDEFVCFQATKGGQGFSTCLLDVSMFPAGSYRIKWLTCCIDGKGSYWNLLPLNAGPVFSILRSPSCR